MRNIQEKVDSGEVLSGCFCVIGSNVTVEIMGHSGLDYVVLDMEHGAGDFGTLYQQLQVVSGTPAAALVRIAYNEKALFKQALDAGADGIVVPFVNSADEATAAVAAMRYPPAGVRGVASSVRATRFGENFAEYMENSYQRLVTVLQIETIQGVEAAPDIAAVDGVDVLFVGPNDLSFSLGLPRQFDHPDFIDALIRVSDSAKTAGKAAGILLQSTDQVPAAIERGYTFISVGSDGGYLNAGARATASALSHYQSNQEK